MKNKFPKITTNLYEIMGHKTSKSLFLTEWEREAAKFYLNMEGKIDPLSTWANISIVKPERGSE